MSERDEALRLWRDAGLPALYGHEIAAAVRLIRLARQPDPEVVGLLREALLALPPAKKGRFHDLAEKIRWCLAHTDAKLAELEKEQSNG